MTRRKKINHEAYKTSEYWNKLLATYGLSVERGRHPKLVYVGEGSKLSVISDLEYTKPLRTAAKPPAE
jgi:hypothetical protein